MAENYKQRMQITVNEKTKNLLEMLKVDNRGISASEIIDAGIWLWAEKMSPETVKTLHERNLGKAGISNG